MFTAVLIFIRTQEFYNAGKRQIYSFNRPGEVVNKRARANDEN